LSGPIFLVLRIASAVVLYAFLVYALWILWSDLRRQTASLASLQTPPLTLILQTGGEPVSYRFTIPEITIGRDPACDCCLDDHTVSAQHTRLSYHHNQWWVQDLHSRNGTFLNQQPVSEPLVIVSGDQIRCGQAVFQTLLEDNLE
jgi:pSer/pThr/pTyr-binding forkhead associated (FHA) protein